MQLGYLSIKGIGQDIAVALETEREKHGSFSSLTDFLTRCSDAINKKSLESLIKSGALDCFADRMTLVANTTRILDWVKSIGDHQQQGGGLFAVQDVE
ncbi:MAG: hypothetical protein H6765_01410 [Candidatus Peribacteria bacterium]|nr:MAG: hypothetical protein H6765_01410 [Candidatus Peribacteria bacterium]